MSIAEEITRIKSAKDALKTVINAKGGNLTDELIDQYAVAVNDINTGYDTSSVTVTADTMLSGVVAIGKNGETITGNIETAIPTVSGNVFTVAKGFVAQDTELTVPEATVTETETMVTVSAGYVPETLTFKTGEDVEYGVIDEYGTFQKLDLSGDAPVNDGEATDAGDAGVFETGMDEADYNACPVFFDPDEPYDANKPLTFTLMRGSTQADITAPDILYYRYGTSGEWIRCEDSKIIHLSIYANTSVQFWTDITADRNIGTFTIENGKIGCSGNIHSLLNYQDLHGVCFEYLFKNCTGLEVAPALTATVLPSGCYEQMFMNCVNLTTVPVFAAKELAGLWSCAGMFAFCSKLSSFPDFALDCKFTHEAPMNGMFAGCTSLTVAPKLPQSVPSEQAYFYFFENCTGLTEIPELLQTRILSGRCYDTTFKGCTGLTSVDLPFKDYQLAEECFKQMFLNCTNLSSVTVRFTKWQVNDTDISEDWLKNVARTGTFYKPSALPEEYGDDRIPVGWTVVNID